MKIQVVVSSLDFGGAERVAASLANAWAKRKHEVILTLFDSPRTDGVYATDPRVRRISLSLSRPSHNFLQAMMANTKRILALRRTFKQARPDVVVSFMAESNVLAILAGLGLDATVIVSEHTDPFKHQPGRAWAFLRRQTYKWATAVVVLTSSAEAFFKAQIGTKVRLIPNPIVIDSRVNGTDAHLRLDRHVILAMGRLCPEKNFETLIKAFASIKNNHPDWRLVILGDGPSRGSLESLVDSLDLGCCVSLPGAVDDPFSYLRRADLFVSSSLLEGFPMAICEAMACGRPVIALEYGAGLHEIITHGINGVVLNEGGVGQLANTIVDLIEHPKKRRRLGAAAADISERYGLDVVMAKWDALFAEMPSSRGNSDMRLSHS